jgi:hypothetical protein
LAFEYAISTEPPLAIRRGCGVVDAEMWYAALQQLTADPLFSSNVPVVPPFEV